MINNEEFDKLTNIADILQSDWRLGISLLISQNIDLDLFVYHLLDNYNWFKIPGEMEYKYNHELDNWNFNGYIGNNLQYGKIFYRELIDLYIYNNIKRLIDKYNNE